MKKRHLLASAAVAAVLVFGSGGAAVASTTLLPPTITSASTTFTVESPAHFAFRSQAGSAVPARYEYQLNAEPPQQVDARSGRASVTVFPDRFSNQLSVTSLAADGSRSDPATFTFTATFPPPSADQDVNGDGVPDLITVGGTAGLASGLWQATGRGDNGRVQTPALNIGSTGNGVFGDNSPNDFDGAQVITGKFAGTSFEDFLVYYPGGVDAGGGAIITGNGRGAVLSAQLSGHEFTIPSGMLTDLNGDNPIQVVNGYDAAGRGAGFPDLIGIVGDPVAGRGPCASSPGRWCCRRSTSDRASVVAGRPQFRPQRAPRHGSQILHHLDQRPQLVQRVQRRGGPGRVDALEQFEPDEGGRDGAGQAGRVGQVAERGLGHHPDEYGLDLGHPQAERLPDGLGQGGLVLRAGQQLGEYGDVAQRPLLLVQAPAEIEQLTQRVDLGQLRPVHLDPRPGRGEAGLSEQGVEVAEVVEDQGLVDPGRRGDRPR
jgi:hypothetical protein